MMTDPIADMLTRLRNALRVHKEEVVIPFSQIKFSIAQVLLKEGFVEAVEQTETSTQQARHTPQTFRIRLKYIDGEKPAMTTLKRISKPGRRLYAGYKELRPVLNNLGIALLSTPSGIISNKEAKARRLGGEIICEVS